MLIVDLFTALLKSKRDLILENLVLRQQLAIQQRSIKRPKIKNIDRIFWVWLFKIWDHWKSALIIVKPQTVIGWHHKGFKLYWRWKSHRTGRPTTDWELIKLIRRFQKENPTWSSQRIQGELAKLGYTVCDNTVAKYMQKHSWDDASRQLWLTFRRECLNHVITLNERHLHSVLNEYINEYYNISRTHISLKKDSPVHRPLFKPMAISLAKPSSAACITITAELPEYKSCSGYQAKQRTSAPTMKIQQKTCSGQRKPLPNQLISTCQ